MRTFTRFFMMLVFLALPFKAVQAKVIKLNKSEFRLGPMSALKARGLSPLRFVNLYNAQGHFMTMSDTKHITTPWFLDLDSKVNAQQVRRLLAKENQGPPPVIKTVNQQTRPQQISPAEQVQPIQPVAKTKDQPITRPVYPWKTGEGIVQVTENVKPKGETSLPAVFIPAAFLLIAGFIISLLNTDNLRREVEIRAPSFWNMASLKYWGVILIRLIYFGWMEKAAASLAYLINKIAANKKYDLGEDPQGLMFRVAANDPDLKSDHIP